MSTRIAWPDVVCVIAVAVFCASSAGLAQPAATAPAGQLHVGTAEADITPALPAAVTGQFNLRVARTAETPLTASVLVLESREGGRTIDCAIMVSCDLISIPSDVLAQIRAETAKLLPDLDPRKIFIAATHTHTAPVLGEEQYLIPAGVLTVADYRAYLSRRVAEAVAKAWAARSAGSVGWGLGHAVVAYNRRASYANGSAVMYGKTDRPDFRNLEGYEDHDVNCLFAWNAEGKLVAAAVNVSCTAQEVESRSAVNADFWHPTRAALRKRLGADLCVLAWTGAAGDQSPHLMYRKSADERMMRLRGLTRMEEIARRIDRAVEEAYEAARKDRRAAPPLAHRVQTLRLPMRLVTPAEHAEAKAACEDAAARIAKDPKAADDQYRRLKWYEQTVRRFEAQKDDPAPVQETEIHVLRVGEAVICTNPFELFTDYGVRIKARSRAGQTFVVQLVGGPTSYLPTERAVPGGGYSAIVHSGLVGPDGGRMLVDKTVEMIESLWR